MGGQGQGRGGQWGEKGNNYNIFKIHLENKKDGIIYF